MNPFVKILSDNEQDRAEAESWWRDATEEDKLRVWLCIQRDYEDPVMEIMSRLAQLAFAEMALRLDGGGAADAHAARLLALCLCET